MYIYIYRDICGKQLKLSFERTFAPPTHVTCKKTIDMYGEGGRRLFALVYLLNECRHTVVEVIYDMKKA
jgi:hypothetical protein